MGSKKRRDPFTKCWKKGKRMFILMILKMGSGMLAQVILPQFCQSIGRFAFEDCKQLVGIDIPDTVTFIGPAAFRACPLRSLKIPRNVTEIECCLCQDCCSLERVDFPETLTAIGAASYICQGDFILFQLFKFHL